MLVGLAHFLAAVASLTLTRWSSGLATLWVPNAILLAFLLNTDRTRWVPATLAVWVSGTAANWIGGAPLPFALLFGATNGLEPLGVAWLLGATRRKVDLEQTRDLVAFVAVAALMNMLMATIAAGAAASMGVQFGEIWLSWFSSSFLGLLIAAPLLQIGFRHLRALKLTGRALIEAVAVLLLVGGAGALAFFQSRWPIFYVVLPPIVVATFRLRAVGAAASVLLLAALGTAAVVQGVGPFSVPGTSFGERLAMLQLFLAIAILTALPVAAILSERDRFAASLAQREEQLGSVVDAVSDVIFRTDREGQWTYLNPAWEVLTGLAVEESIGRSVLEHVEEADRAELTERLSGLSLGLFDTVRHQFRFRTARGDHRWGEVQARRLVNLGGEMTGAAGIIVDISDRLAIAAMADDARRRAEQEADAALMLAATDELTGLASRRAFLTLLDQQLAAAQPLALALFDIDYFKQVNDSLGHAAGDEVLRGLARVAQSCVRDRDVVGRLGGEEFAVLMPGASLDQAAAIGERLRRACAEAVYPPGVSVTISIGVAAANEGSVSSSLLRDADAALYQAKFDGRNCLRLAA